MPDTSKKVASNTLVQIIGRFLQAGFGLITAGILMNVMGIGGFGNYTLVLTYSLFFGAFSDFGLIRIVIREISQLGLNNKRKVEYKGKKYIETADNVIGTALGISLSGTFVILLAFIAAVFLTDYSTELKIAILIGLVGEYFNSFRMVEAVLTVRMKIYYITFGLLLTSFITFLSAVLLKILNPSHAIIWMAIGWSISKIISAGVIVYFSLREKNILPIKFNFYQAKKMVLEGLPLTAAIILGVIYYRVDSVMLKSMSGEIELGEYGAAYKFIDVVAGVGHFFMVASTPILAYRYIKDKELFKRAYQRAFNFLLMIGLPILILFIFLAPYIIHIVYGESVDGDSLDGSISILRVLSVGFPFVFLNNLYVSLLIILKKNRSYLLMSLVGAVVNIIFNWIAIPHYGGEGASYATVFTQILMLITGFWLVHRDLKIYPSFSRLIKIAISGVITVGVTYLAYALISDDSFDLISNFADQITADQGLSLRIIALCNLITVGILGLVVYCLSIFGFKAITIEEIKYTLKTSKKDR